MVHFPNGTNAIVAVISYTGYNMEDAMILKKSAHKRDFAYGTIYKSHIVDIHPNSAGRSSCEKHFGLRSSPVDLITANASFQKMVKKVDSDGIARIGSKLKFGDLLCAYVDMVRGRTHWEKYKGDEETILDEVRLIGKNHFLSFIPILVEGTAFL
ncbi:hypothetical protein BY996DRAFT_6424543 [Phakopsora pachyrhizi]|nr:hypothetical protein BY996DRAFT_6424543 [Phakopsora pachyrhizi]